MLEMKKRRKKALIQKILGKITKLSFEKYKMVTNQQSWLVVRISEKEEKLFEHCLMHFLQDKNKEQVRRQQLWDKCITSTDAEKAFLPY